MKYRYYLFDFDGTIADTGEGIRRSVAWAAERLGLEVPGLEILNRFIGPPLHDSFMRYFSMEPAGAEHAVEVYRERYIDIGLYESKVYPYIPTLLKALRRRGAYVGLASVKPQMMVERLAEYFGIRGDIDAISGIGMGPHSADKRDVLLSALPAGTDPAEVCMIGDRCYDIVAARALGMRAVGAGYGYALPGELADAGADEVFDSPRALAEALLEGDMPRGAFITMEGSDGCGKSTQIAKLRTWLEQRGYEVVLTREPGGCPISEKLREIILSLDSTGMSPECEALLYAASRAELVREVIEPALKLGKIVICDRFLDSSIAYQAYGRELGEAFIRQINNPALHRASPDATLLLRVDRARAKARMAGGAAPDRLEREKEDFFARVAEGYEAVRREEPHRVRAIDASRGIDEVFEDVKSAVEEALRKI